MRIAVTGAVGEVGRVACDAVLAAGHDLQASDRRLDPALPYPVRCVELLDPMACHRAVEGCEAVIHLGNHPHHRGKLPQAVFAENGAMNVNLFQAALEQGLQRVVFASSIQVVAGLPMLRALDAGVRSALPELPLDGDTPPNPGNVYAASKAAAEQLLRAYAAREPAIAWVALRLPGVMTELWPRWDQPHRGHLRDELFTAIRGHEAGALLLAAATRATPGYRCYQGGTAELSIDRPLDEVVATWFADTPLRADLERLAAPVDLAVLERELGWQPDPEPWAWPTRAAWQQDP